MNRIFVFLWILVFASEAMAVTKNSFVLSAEEQAYLKQKKVITMCVDPDWEPFEIINAEGKHEGIAADLIS